MENTVASQQAPNPNNAKSSEGLSGEAMSALGYLCGIIAIVALCVDPFNKDQKVRFNAMQAVVLQATYLIGLIALGIISTVVGGIASYALSAMNMYGTLGFILGIFPVLTMTLSFGMFVGTVLLIISAAQGGTPRIPVIANFADNILNKAKA